MPAVTRFDGATHPVYNAVMRVEAALVLLGVSLASTQPPQPAPSTPPGQAAPTGPGRGGRPPQALAPMAATTRAANPEPYVRLTATVTAAAAQRYGGTPSPGAQDRAAGAGPGGLVLR